MNDQKLCPLLRGAMCKRDDCAWRYVNGCCMTAHVAMQENILDGIYRLQRPQEKVAPPTKTKTPAV